MFGYMFHLSHINQEILYLLPDTNMHILRIILCDQKNTKQIINCQPVTFVNQIN